MIIVESIIPLTIGSIVPISYLEFSDEPTINGMVIRVVTEEQYVIECLADESLPIGNRHLMAHPNRYWYQVSID